MTEFTQADMHLMALDASLDSPDDPMLDDLLSANKKYHREMAQYAVKHQRLKEHARQQRNSYALVLIGGEYCDPELDLRLAELEGKKEEERQKMLEVYRHRMDCILSHYDLVF